MQDEQDEFPTFGDPLHYIQREIIFKLKGHASLSHAKLKPEGLAGHAFGHHLSSLSAKKLIQKLEDGTYTLTAKGKIYSDYASVTTGRLKLRPSSGIFLLITDSAQQVLLYSSQMQPLFGYTGLLFYKTRLGQNTKESLEIALSKRGIKIDRQEIKLAGTLNIKYTSRTDSSLIAQRVGPLFALKLNSDFDPQGSKLNWFNQKELTSTEALQALKLSRLESADFLDLEIRL